MGAESDSKMRTLRVYNVGGRQLEGVIEMIEVIQLAIMFGIAWVLYCKRQLDCKLKASAGSIACNK